MENFLTHGSCTSIRPHSYMNTPESSFTGFQGKWMLTNPWEWQANIRGIMALNCCVHYLDLWGETGSWILAVQCSQCWLLWTDVKLGALKAPLFSFLFKHKLNLTLIWRETLYNWISQWYSFFCLRLQLNFQFTAEPSLLSCPAAPSQLLLELCSRYSIRWAKPGAAATPLWAELSTTTKVNSAVPFPFPFSSRSVMQYLISTHSWPLLNCWEMFSSLQEFCHPLLSLLVAFSAPALGCCCSSCRASCYTLVFGWGQRIFITWVNKGVGRAQRESHPDSSNLCNVRN